MATIDVDPLFVFRVGDQTFSCLAMYCSARTLLRVSNTCRSLAECTAAEFRHWLKKAPAVHGGVTRMLAFAAGLGPVNTAKGDAEWNAFRVLYDRYIVDDAFIDASQNVGRWTPRDVDPRLSPLAPWLQAPLWPVVRARLALHAWAMLYWILRTGESEPRIWAGEDRESAFLDLLNRTWEVIWRFPAPLPTLRELKDPSAVPLEHRDILMHGSPDLVLGSVDAFTSLASVASKSVYPRMILLCLRHNLARPLHILLSTFGIPETAFTPKSDEADKLFLGTGIENITSSTSGTFWRYTLQEARDDAELVAYRFGGRKEFL